MPDRIPRYDDGQPWGVNFFRTMLSENDLSNLTLPRTYFGRLQISNVSFRDTDFTELAFQVPPRTMSAGREMTDFVRSTWWMC
jgi:hypothetical protein